MKANVGSFDRIARFIIGVGLIAATVTGFIGVWGWIGIVPLGTAVFRFCPLYVPLGFSSCAAPKSE